MRPLVATWSLIGIIALSGMFLSCGADPDDSVLSAYARALEAFESGDFTGAKVALSGARDFHPARVLSGKVEFFLGDPLAAEKAFRRAVRSRPSSLEARIWLIRCLRANGKGTEAERLVESVLADDPSNVSALRLAAEQALNEGKNADAFELLDRAIDASGETALAFMDRARLLWVSGESVRSVDDLTAALGILPRASNASSAALRLVETIREESK